NGTELLPIDGHRLAFFKRHLEVFCLSFGTFRRARKLENILRWFSPGVLENSALIRDMHQVAIGRIWFCSRGGNRNAMGFRVSDQITAPVEFPLTPRRNYFDVR